jgi:N-acetylated-alpha-linked acidic dipeptidase
MFALAAAYRNAAGAARVYSAAMERTLMLSLLVLASAGTAEAPLAGFGPPAAAAQRQLEARYDARLRPEDLGPWMDRLAARPHHVGSEWGRRNVEFLAEQFRAWGYDTRVEEFSVLFPTPRVRLLEMVAPTRFRAALAEPPLPQDRTSGQQSEQLPVYNAYSADGDVTGELVYVNFGVPEDYEELERRGIDVKGRIVLARYYGSWRGIKPKVAAEHGAIGCVIFSDPHEDGYFLGDVYPRGGWRNEHGAQRGSVADMPLYPGDPLTPGVGATAGAPRVELSEAATLTKIPVLPISYADALPLLRALGGPMAPESWRGSLPTPYHLGPGPARVRLKLEFDWSRHPIRNVIAVLPGSELPDQWIVRGNHHDAWVNGAADPVSGLVAMMAEARAVGELAREGRRPRRTLVYAAWDGEEPGLLGSTEWAEAHADELRAKAAVYVNSDSNSRGILGAGGSHSLERLVAQVARDVEDPVRKVSVGERLRAQRIVGARSEEARRDAWDRADIRLGALGSGSDYTPFLQHLGVASLNLSFDGEDEYGQYHSIYDSIDHYRRFMDDGHAYGIVQARTTGRVVLRLANADVLPFEFTNLAETVGRYVKEVGDLADERRRAAEEARRRRERAIDLLAADTRLPYVDRPLPPGVPHLNLAPLRNAAARLEQAARAYEKAVEGIAGMDAARRAAVDGVLLKAERAFTRPEGLPRRPWYRHQIYAPGWYTGYGVKTLPAVREAIEQGSYGEVDPAVSAAAGSIESYAAEVERATALLEGKPPAAR